MAKCPFDDDECNIGYDTPCPVCGALGSDQDAWDKCVNATGKSFPVCDSCGVNQADPPSKLCPGCQAYREHQQ